MPGLPRLKLLRQKKKISLRKLAGLTGIPRSNINDFENGIRTPQPGELEKIAKVLNVKPEDLE